MLPSPILARISGTVTICPFTTRYKLFGPSLVNTPNKTSRKFCITIYSTKVSHFWFKSPAE